MIDKKENRREFLKNSGLTTAALAAGAGFQFSNRSYANTPKPPNILFIAIDDLKPILGCYGDTKVISPNIDAISAEGTTFLNNHCQYPVCGPSRASLMTSLMPEVTGVIGFKQMRAIIPDVLTLPQHFRNNGYETAATGKINDPRCVEGGREKDDEPSWSIPYRKIAYDGMYKQEIKLACEAPAIDDCDHEDSRICDEGLKLMRQMAKADKPFFLAVGFKKPHLPFLAPKKYWDRYKREDFKVHPFQQRSKNAVEYTWHNSEEMRGYAGIPDEGDISTDKQLELIHGYHACVTFIDSQVGRLTAELKRLKVADNTIIVLWGDHGWHLGDHNLWGKHTNLEQAARSPLIIAAPDFGKPGKTNSPTGFLDIFPTLCDLADLPTPEELQGKSLTPLMKNPRSSVRKGIVTLFRRGAIGYAYRNKRYRYIEWVKNIEGTVALELYDYKTDPMETVNLATDERYRALVKDLAKDLRQEGIGCLLLDTKGK
ncbi:MAG: sulfatase [Planctomycetes bacterium]|nr:sulfatase [Planctomycetota bacterium]